MDVLSIVLVELAGIEWAWPFFDLLSGYSITQLQPWYLCASSGISGGFTPTPSNTKTPWKNPSGFHGGAGGN
jgi:hypothetical protein